MSSTQITLYDYQKRKTKEIVDTLYCHHLCYLAAEVRTGKTPMFLMSAQLVGYKSVLVITKKIAIPDILDFASKMQLDYQLEVINYESLHKIEGKYALVVIDESHTLGSYPKLSKTWKKVREFCKGADVLLSSGTPSPESYSMLYHQFKLSDQSPWTKDYPTFYRWAKEYVDVEEEYIGSQKHNNYDNGIEEKILPDVEPYMVNLTQADAGFTQYPEEHFVYVDMKPMTYNLASIIEDKKVYESKCGNWFLTPDRIVKQRNLLHQIYSGSVIAHDVLEQNKKVMLFDDSKAAKMAKMFKGKKVAIYYQFKGEYELLKKHFPNHTDDPQKFRENDDLTFIRQFISGKEGVNLSTADLMAFYNISYSATVYFQVRARLQTKDREKPVQLYWFFAKNGIEQDIYAAVSNKKKYTKEHFVKSWLNGRVSNSKADPQQGTGPGVVAGEDPGGLKERLAGPTVAQANIGRTGDLFR